MQFINKDKWDRLPFGRKVEYLKRRCLFNPTYRYSNRCKEMMALHSDFKNWVEKHTRPLTYDLRENPDALQQGIQDANELEYINEQERYSPNYTAFDSFNRRTSEYFKKHHNPIYDASIDYTKLVDTDAFQNLYKELDKKKYYKQYSKDYRIAKKQKKQAEKNAKLLKEIKKGFRNIHAHMSYKDDDYEDDEYEYDKDNENIIDNKGNKDNKDDPEEV